MDSNQIKQQKQQILADYVEAETVPRQRGSINKTILSAALQKGATLSEAARVAGSLAEHPSATARDVLERDPELKEEVIAAYKSLEEKMLQALEDRFTDFNEVDYDKRVSALSRITANRQLLEGKPTSKIEITERLEALIASIALEQ